MPSLKVIGGKFKGLKLEMLDLPITRPTKAILKESLFNTLQNDIVQYGFFEAFGGSGSVGIEALSRGAIEATFIEANPQSFEVLKHNLSKLPSTNYRFFLGDSFTLLPKLLAQSNLPSILYLDPPFCIRENMEDIYQRCFHLVQEISNPLIQVVIFEYLSTLELPKRLGNFCIIKQKKFGKSSLGYYMKEDQCQRKK
ncbi:16S rRNA (guanine(966)-N(2))-methyltransferase RsmD [Helicobacter pametensis]|uniref:16S rRNA (guanine(966)-N(2))-methyltransferase RsmD n=1 Tax=Helicobacter pametensis TaxID=95149 RepID=UPI0004826855|nr:16S rRNA (guanine(966)-N(2))-methyltransferase RsmD [Helicobacter pametensis]